VRGIQAGGSLAGKVSIRLPTISSSTDAIVSFFCEGPTFARPLRLRWCDVIGVIDISLGGPCDRGRVDQFMLSRPELEGEDDQRDAKIKECSASVRPLLIVT
jgi:hypothetical protein